MSFIGGEVYYWLIIITFQLYSDHTTCLNPHANNSTHLDDFNAQNNLFGEY